MTEGLERQVSDAETDQNIGKLAKSLEPTL